jgi:hypothetical protein
MVFELITSRITGRLAMSVDDCAIIEEIAPQCSTWIEIGTLWGGSAILAALSNPNLKVIAIDPIERYQNEAPTCDDILANFLTFNVAHQISLVKAKSDPWPLPLDFVADAVMIDGDHSLEALESDWNNAKRIAKKFILIHDYDDPPIRKFTEKIRDFKIVKSSPRMIALERL